MAIEIKEFVGPKNIFNQTDNNGTTNFKESASDLLAPSPDTLMCTIEGIHSYPYHTRNYTRYMPDCLKASIKQWTYPYKRPIIKHHLDQTGDIIGRIYSAEYSNESSIPNVGCINFTSSIPSKEASEQVQSGLLDTVSIGVVANDVRCSICGSHIVDSAEGCPEGHVRGGVYENETCYWDIYGLQDVKELSFVITPSDAFAKTKKIYKAAELNSKTSIMRNENAADNLSGNVNIKEVDSKNKDNGETNLMEKELEEQKAKVAELEAELAKAKAENEKAAVLEAEVAKLKAEKEEADKKLADIQALLDNKDKELEDEKAKLVVSEEELAKAKDELKVVSEEKESADKASLELAEQFKGFAGKILNQYRKITKKRELKEEELNSRSMESLLVSVTDLAEELNTEVKEEVVDIQEGAGKVPNPAAPKDVEEKPKKTTPDNDYSNVNLSEGLESLFKQAASVR